MAPSPSMHSTPVLVTAKGLARLRKAGPDSAPEGGQHREEFIQELVHSHPAIIPMLDIEPAYTPLISVCRELETPAGFLDNLWITPEGGLVLGECKLIRNPQARREVVVQALDYARGISSWGFEELERQSSKARKEPGFKLWDLVPKPADLDEAQFHDSVERRLVSGNLMVLIIGDGISEGAEALTSYLQMHAGFRAGLALVDLSVWDLADGSRLVVPRVPMRTVLVERGVIKLDVNGALRVEPPAATQSSAKTDTHTASEAEFFEQLRTRLPEVVEGVRAFAASLSSVGITPEFRKSLVLRWMPSPDFMGSAGYVDSYGTVWLGDAFATAMRLGNEAAGSGYLGAVANAVGGSVKQRPKSGPTVVGPSGKTVHISELLPVQDKWLAAIADFVSVLSLTLKLEPSLSASS